MKTLLVPTFLAGALCAWLWPQDKPKQAVPASVADMMKKARKYTEPGPAHRLLERFLGKWRTEMTIFSMGRKFQSSKGTAEYSWLHEGRWLQGKSSGSMMGRPLKTFSILGYDNFKRSYVTTNVSTMDTALNRSEGDLDPSGKALLLYGTIDEYLTGEHDKMVKTVFRFEGDDRMVMEIHDLPIGMKNTKVVEISYTRTP